MPPLLLLGGVVAILLMMSRKGRVLVENATDAATAAMGETMLSEHFTLSEMTTTGSGLDNTPTPEALANLTRLCRDTLEPMRALWGGTVRVTSGYRSPAVNANAGGSSTSDHMNGSACDCYPDGLTNEEAATIIYNDGGDIPIDQIIVEHHTGHLHVGAGSLMRRDFLQTFDGVVYSAWSPTT